MSAWRDRPSRPGVGEELVNHLRLIAYAKPVASRVHSSRKVPLDDQSKRAVAQSTGTGEKRVHNLKAAMLSQCLMV